MHIWDTYHLDKGVVQFLYMKYKSITKMIKDVGGTGYPANRRRREVRLEVVKKTPQPRMKQYGDRGYKPSSGKGVGY